jgi:hypothetical protein
VCQGSFGVILHPSSFILHPSSFILHPSSFILHPSSVIRHLGFGSAILHESFRACGGGRKNAIAAGCVF